MEILFSLITIALVVTIVFFVMTKKNDANEIKILVDAGVMKDQSIKANEERLKETMKKMAVIDKENIELRELNAKLQTVVNLLLTVSPRYVLKAFSEKKLVELVQKEMLIEKKELFGLNQSVIADRA